jgi:hypothetical protein
MIKHCIAVIMTPLIVGLSLLAYPPVFGSHIMPCNFAPAKAFEAARATILARHLMPMVIVSLVFAVLTVRGTRWFLAPCAFAALSAVAAFIIYRQPTSCLNSLEDFITDGPGWAALMFAAALSLATGRLVDRIGNSILAMRTG